MSLINDAIKQATKANKDRAATTPESGASPTAGMQTAEARPMPAPSGSMTGMFLISGIVLFVLLGGTLLFLAMRNVGDGGTDGTTRTPSPAVAATPPASTTKPAPAPAVATQPAQPAVSAPATQPVVVTSSTTTSAAPVVAPTNPTTAPPAIVEVPAKPAGPRAFPELKLQGIYYRIKDPSVMINGKTLEIGDLINDVTVIRIERKEVTVELDGQQKVLRLQ